MKYLTIIACCSMLVACKTTGEMNYGEKKDFANKLYDKCVNEYKVKTRIELEDCFKQEVSSYNNQTVKVRAALAELGDGLSRAGTTYGNNRSVNCTRYGNTVTCY
jgi:hypothetical protein